LGPYLETNSRTRYAVVTGTHKTWLFNAQVLLFYAFLSVPNLLTKKSDYRLKGYGDIKGHISVPYFETRVY